MKQARTQGVEITHERMWCADAKREERDAAQREEEHAGAAPVAVAPIGLADDDGGPDLTSLAELEAASGPAIGESQTGSSCPKCGGFMAVSAVICTSCGFNAATGKAAKTMTGKEADKDEKKSKRGKKRPEEMSDRELADWETSREVVRKAYLTPIVIFLICSGLTMAIYAGVGGAFAGLGVMGYMINFAVTAPITIATFYFCAVLFIGFDEPFSLVVIRMCAVLAATGLAEAAGYALNAHTPGLGMILWLVPWFVYISMMVTLMELDIADALIVGFVSGFIKFIATIAVVVWVFSMMMAAGAAAIATGVGATGTVGSWDESPGYFVDGDGDTLDDYIDLPQADYDLWLEDTGGERSPFEWLYGDFDTGDEEP